MKAEVRAEEVIPSIPGVYNLENYEETYDSFSWKDAAQELSFRRTGKLNAAYEAVDRHVDEGHGEKIALHFAAEDERRSMTFKPIIISGCLSEGNFPPMPRRVRLKYCLNCRRRKSAGRSFAAN